jgi:sugar-specific transcriptional regulator TrmB
MSSTYDNTGKPASQILSALHDVGLSEDESQVYLACLQLGARPASVIARKSGHKRGHTYNLLESLTEKALVQEFIKENVRQFVANSPHILLSLLETKEQRVLQQKESLRQVLPELEEVYEHIPSKPKMRLFRGEEGIRSIYEDTLSCAEKIIYAVGDFASTFPARKNNRLHEWMWEYSSRRARQGIWYHGIMNQSSTSDLAFQRRRAQKRKMKMLHQVPFSVEMMIYDSKVAITSTAEDMSGVILEDRNIADTLRNFHRGVWSFLPDYEEGRE